MNQLTTHFQQTQQQCSSLQQEENPSVAITNNSVVLCGRVSSQPTFTHELFGEKFYEVTLAVKRLSGQEDTLPVCISQHLLNDQFTEGALVRVEGQFRSYNKFVGEHSKLMLTVFVRDVLPYDDKINPNTLTLNGYICKAPVYRTTPFSREICDILVAVNRQYNKSDYIPCIVWGRNARYASTLAVGQHVKLLGRVQSRTYQKKINDDEIVSRVAYEVSVGSICAEP